MYKLGIDIGINNIGLGIYDTKTKQLIKKKYISYKKSSAIMKKTLRSINTKNYLKFLIKKIDSFLGNTKIEYIGVACPGKVNTEKNIFFGSKELHVTKINFNKVLKKYNCPVYIENDCNCVALGEALSNKYDKFLMITIGTELGFSLVRKTRNKISLANDEKLKTVIELNKIPNTKNKRYIESFKYLSELYNKRQNETLPREAIFEDLRHNKDIIEKYITNFSKGINLINKKVKIKNICIGGSFSLHKRHYLQKMKNNLPKHEIFIAKNYNDAGIIGAINLPIKRY